jgi:peptidyl-prolyl cis-trans isomerase C
MRIAPALCCLCACVASLASNAVEPGLTAGTLAMVNGLPLSLGLLDELARARQTGGAPPELLERRRMLDDLVNMEVLSQRAQATGIAARPQVRAELELADKTLLGQRLQQQMVTEMKIDEAELQARYRALPANVQIDASHILVRDEALARNLIAQLQRGASFAELARKHSQDAESRQRGGALGPMPMDEMVPTLAAAAQTLKPGQYTREPVKTGFGWHVIQLNALRTLPPPPFEKLKAGLRNEIATERLQAQIVQWRKEAKLTMLQAP